MTQKTATSIADSKSNKVSIESRRNFIIKMIIGSVACGLPVGTLLSCDDKNELEERIYRGTGKVPYRI
jgi:hypothetical protein